MSLLPLASITLDGVVLFFHVLAAIVAFGPTFAYGILLATAVKANQAAVPTVIDGVRRVDSILGLPGLIVLIVTGIWLVLDGGLPWDWSDTFVSVGLTAAVILLAMFLFYFRPLTRQGAELAARDIKASGQLSEEFEALSKRIAIGGQVATLVVLVALFFMVVKP